MQLSKEPRELNREWLIVLSELGQGAFGIVYEASLSEPKAPEIQVAAKSLRKDAMDNEREELLEEALVMAQMEHANVVGLIGVITKGRPIYVVLEHMRNGSLKDYVMNKTCTPAQQVTWSRQVASGMAHIHSLGFIHRDLAARNVLLSASLTAKVADFGLARESTDDAYYRSRGGNVPVRWTAPEALEDNIFSEKSDVWAFGVLMYEVYTKAAMPYTGWNNQRVWIEVTNGFRLPCPADCPLPVFKIMSMCWLHDRHERPSFETLVKALAALETDSDMSSLFQS
uniref:RTKC8 Kinase domain n=1 Tax=Monosiga brevicollis TaxID=81824 RepID=UPI00255C27D9|nr:Chain A, RTKC8 Kinase domain [Monosiga brevicollis]